MSFLAELKRRNVFRVAMLYLVAGWLVLQVADVLSGVLGLPDWTLRLIALILGLGFLFVVIFAWVYELTPEGVKRASEVPADASITDRTGSRLNLVIAALLVVAVGLLGVQMLLPSSESRQPATAAGSESRAADASETAVAAPDSTTDEPASDRPSLAVLPFVNLSSDPEQEYFSDGLAESLLHLLAQVPELQVAARTSSFRFKGQGADIGEISRQLKVGHVLEGSVRRAGDTIRVTAQLIKAADGFNLWSGTYDRKLEDVFAIQDEIAEHVSDALQVALLGESAAPIAAHDTDLEAYEAYLRGRQQLAITSFESLPRAVDYFERALEIDPGYLNAAISLAETLTRQANTGMFPFRDLAQKLAPVTRRIERIAPQSPYVWTLKGYEAMPGKGPGHPDVLPLFRRAWDMAPEDTFTAYHYATMLNWSNQPEAAIEVASRALRTNPLSDELNMRLGFAHFFAGNFEASIRYGEYLKALEPDRPTGFQIVADAEAELGQFGAAFAGYEQSRIRDPNDAEADASMAMTLLAMNASMEAEAILDRLDVDETTTIIPRLARVAVSARRGERESLKASLGEIIVDGPPNRSWGEVAASLMIVDLYAAGALSDGQWLEEAFMGAPDSPEIRRDMHFWLKLALVPALRAEGRAALADEILAAARSYAEEMAPIDVPMFGIHFAERDIDSLVALMERDLEDGPGLFWWLFYENAILDFAKGDERYQGLIRQYRDHASSEHAAWQQAQQSG